MKLRPYEINAVRDLHRLLKKRKRVVGVAPTGSGKTVIGAALIRKMRGKRVLWIAHRIELLKQALEQLIAAGIPSSALGLLAGSGAATLRDGTVIGPSPNASVIVASVDMFRVRVVPQVDLIVVDEAHRVMAQSYRDIIDAQPKAWVLGLTATPWRLDGSPLGDVFCHLHVMAEAVELIDEKFIAGPVVFGVPRDKARAIVGGLKSGRGDYSGKQAERVAMRYLMGDVVAECARLAPDARTLVFATTRKHGRALAKKFARSGRRTEYLDGDTPGEDRAGMLKSLQSGETEVIVNVDVLSEGFDCPPVKCIALARPTRSLTRFMQQCGRGSRTFGNKRPIILDHAGNVWRFGLPDSPREWSLDGRVKVAATGDAPVKQCVSCEALIAAGCGACPECGAEQPMTSRQLRVKRAELERMKRAAAERDGVREALRKIASAKGRPVSWVEQTLERLCA